MGTTAPYRVRLRYLVLCVTSLAAVARVTAAADVNHAEVKRLGAALAERYDALERAVRQVPDDRFAAQVAFETVGRDPAALAAWLREHTRLLPYRGVLRGSVGVLVDRGGNSL